MDFRLFLHNLADAIGLVLVAALLAVLLAFGIGFGPGLYSELGDGRGPVQHGDNPAQGGTSANPNGVGDGGGGIHNIAGIQDQQGRNGGTPPACTAHAGMGDGVGNPNC